jgi:hypothetical protein
MSQRIPIYIPTYINSIEYTPARVLPRLFFYNGLLDCEQYWIESGSAAFGGVTFAQTAFPYFDNYNVVSGQFPTTGSMSLLFNNENASYGEIPNENLYTKYWEAYISLLYNPYTRLVNASAIIPLADYFKMELNDIVNFKGNYYHLRAINDYSLKTGECDIQLLGPIMQTEFATDFVNTPTTTTTTAGPTTTTTTFSNNPCNCVEINLTSEGGEVATFNCYGQNENYVYSTSGTKYLCAAVIGGLLQADIVSGTGTLSPIGNCKTGPCPPTPTTTTTTAGTTTTTTAGTTTTTTAGTTTTTTQATTTSTTTLAPGCFTYQVINPFVGPIFNFDYVLCGENFSRSIELPGSSTSSLCIQDDKYERGTGAIVTRTESMCTTTTISPIACNTWVLDPGSSDVWFGNYTDCFGTPVSGAYVDSQSAPFNNFICALGTPQRISGGYLITSGSCSPTTTTTSTTTLAPGCFIYDVVNNGAGTGWVNYVGCGNTEYERFTLAGGASGSICVDNNQINNDGNPNMVWTRTATTCIATTTTTTIAPTTTTTTLPPFSNPFTADGWFDSAGFSYEVQYTGSNSSLTSSIIS